MKSVTLVDYYGSCNGEGKSIGHSPKVLLEYASLLEKEYSLDAILPDCVAEAIDAKPFVEIKRLPYQITEDANLKLSKRFYDKIKLFRNIAISLKEARGDVVWFYRTDFFLFMYIWLHGLPNMRVSKRRKYICLVYQQSFARGWRGKILNYIYERGLARFDAVLYSQKNAVPSHRRSMYIPDYFYDAERYEKYASPKKDNLVVCLGTMNVYKQLEQLVEAFRNLPQKLEIIGCFSDEERCRKLSAVATENVMIENRILPANEYYQKLSSAKYTVLPYDMRMYQGRTSGVLQEALFFQTIPIAPRQLLEENEMPGMGYQNLRDLENARFWCIREIDEDLRNQLASYPSKEKIRRNLETLLGTLVE